MRIFALAFLALTAVSTAAPAPGEAACLAEWKRTRTALERAGFKVNHFATTPDQLRREQADLRRQIESLTDPTANTPAHRYGGGNPIAPSPRVRKAPPVGKLGDTRKVR